MPADTKLLKRDVDKKPSPQYFDPVLDEYGYLYGSNGASRHILYGADGNPISTTGNKLAVRATEIETLLSTIAGKDFATQTTLAAILAKIIAAPATEAKQTAMAALIGEVQAAPTANTLLARLKSLEDKIDKITSGETPATTQLSGRITQEVIAEALRTSSVIVDVPVPQNVRGAIVSMRMSAATGTFGAGQGCCLKTQAGAGDGRLYFTASLESDVNTTAFMRQTHFWFPGAAKGDANNSSVASTFKYAGLSPQPILRVTMEISGTFADGEGVTAVCKVTFIV
jgi:hypothetical protein